MTDLRIAATAILILVPAITVWWYLPKWQMRFVTAADPKARADIEDNFRKTIGQGLGGLFVLGGAALAYLQFTHQQQAAHDLLISNQVGRAFEQLGSDKLAVSLGGVYELEGVMNTSEQYHQPVLEALCAFVRERTRSTVPEDQLATRDEKPAPDIQAALTVIGRRKSGPGSVNLTAAVIRGADLTHSDLRDANLIGADLSGADLRGADLRDANLRGAQLSDALLGDTQLSDARVSQSQLDEACGDPLSLPQDLVMRPLNCRGGRGGVPPAPPHNRNGTP